MNLTGRVAHPRAVMLLAIGALGLCLLWVEFAVMGSGGMAADPAVRAAVAGRRTHAQAAVRSPDAWRSREWRREVDHHAAVIRRHLADGMLSAFLWVVRPGLVRACAPDQATELPEGFEAATRGHGMVVPWAPQEQVLRHRALGGFWTHCGWNSTTEGICEGVLMLCRPCICDGQRRSTPCIPRL